MRVLIAEDDPIQLRLLQAMVKSWGYDAVLAKDGVAAWEILANSDAPGLALLDWLMGGLDGIDVVRRVRANSLPAYLILLSARASAEDVAQGLAAGADDYIRKPVEAAELRARLQVGERVLGLQEALAQRVSELQAEARERRRTEIENRRLVAAIDQASDGVVMTDARGVIEYVNAAFSTISGYSREQVLGRTPSMLKSGVHAPPFYDVLWATISTGQVWRGEITNRRTDGTLYTEQMSITPTRDEGGAISYVAIKKDITAEKAEQAALAREQELLRTLTDHVPDPIYFKDSASRFIRINKALATRFGLADPNDAIGKTDENFYSEEHASQALADEQAIMTTGNPLVAKEECETWPDGRITWVTSSKMALRSADGGIIGTFGVSHDITQRKQMEDELRQSEKRYRFQSLLLHAIYDVSPDGILVVDGHGTILSHNRRFLALWHLDPADYTGSADEPVLAAVLTQVKDPEGFMRRVQELYADPGANDHCEIELKDGRTLDRTSTALQGSQGKYLGRVWFFRDITEQKHVDRTRAVLASIVGASADGIFGVDRGKIVSWNTGAERIYGYTEQEAIGRDVLTLVPPECRSDQLHARETVLRGERISSLETIGVTKDGSYIDVSLNISPIRNKNGAVVSEAVIVHDITARKHAEQVQAEQARLAYLRAGVGAAFTGRATLRAGLQECAEAVVHWTGAAFARIWTLEPGATWLSLEASAGMYTHIDGGHARVPLGSFKIGRIAQNGKPHLSNDVQHDPEIADHAWAKREGLVAFAGYPLIVRNEVVGVLAAFSRSRLGEATMAGFAAIGDQVAQFIDARWAESALRRSEKLARLLFSAIPHPAYVFDLETLDLLEVNDRAVERYGYSRDELLNMKTSDLQAEGRCRASSSANLRLESAGPWKHRTKDGVLIDVEITYHVIDYGGRKAGLTIAQDVTERKKLEIDLRHAQKLESVGRLASGIAHEINTPVQFVGDNLRFLRDAFKDVDGLLRKYENLAESAAAGTVNPDLLDEINEAVDTADVQYLRGEIPKALSQSLDGADRISTIVKAMKDFAHPQQNQKIASNLNEALAGTLLVARNELKYVADIKTDFGELPAVECHLSDMNQVFLNLLINAAHAIGDVIEGSGHRGTILVKTSYSDGWVRITISDNGSGIPEDIRGRIFDPFFTTKDVGRGTGQGLAISRSIVVDKHSGALTFETEVGRGTTFTIALPVEHTTT